MSGEKPAQLLTTADVREIEELLDVHLMKIDTYARRHTFLINRLGAHSVHLTNHFLPVIIDAMGRIPELQPFAEGFEKSLYSMGTDMQDFGEAILMMSAQLRKIFDGLHNFNQKIQRATKHESA